MCYEMQLSSFTLSLHFFLLETDLEIIEQKKLMDLFFIAKPVITVCYCSNYSIVVKKVLITEVH